MSSDANFKTIADAEIFLDIITSSLDHSLAGKYKIQSLSERYRLYRLDAVKTDTCIRLSKEIGKFESLNIKEIVTATMFDISEFYKNLGQENYKRDLQRFLGIRE